MIDLKTNKVRFYDDQENDPESVNTIKVYQITQLRDGSVWVVTANGIFSVDKQTGNLVRYKSQDPDFAHIQHTAFALTERRNGDLIFLAKRGMALLNRASGKTTYYSLPLDEKYEHDHPIVSDSQGNSYFFRMNSLYRFGDIEGLQEFPQAGSVSEFKSIFIDRSDVLWAGTNGQGVRKFNLRAGFSM